jgi:hypothetical protein
MKKKGAGFLLVVGVAALWLTNFIIANPPVMSTLPFSAGVAILGLGCVSIILAMIKLVFGEE